MKYANPGYTVILLALAAGCADAPSRLDQLTDTSTLDSEMGSLSHAEWEPADAGCEGADLAILELFLCEGESTLGALVAVDGGVVCVDSLDVLLDEIAERFAAADPSPQPSHPGAPDAPSTPGGRARGTPHVLSSGGTLADPTPTPVIQADPTPTPVTNPTFDTIPAALSDREPEEEDPTPTPTTDP